MTLFAAPPSGRTHHGSLDYHLILPSIAVLSSIFTAIAVTVLIATKSIDWGARNSSDFSCAPDGQIILPEDVRNAYYSGNLFYNQDWDPSLFLSITLAFGQFTFAQAKAIDICWDLVVGRGGQALFMVLTYPLMRDSVRLSLERRPASFSVVAATAFSKISWTSMWALGHSLSAKPNNARRVPFVPWVRSCNWHFVGLIVVCVYFLVFPTLTAAMTGYQARLSSLVKDPENGNFVPTSSLGQPQATVIDSHRVGLGYGNTALSLVRDTWLRFDLQHHEELYEAMQDHMRRIVLPSHKDETVSGCIDSRFQEGFRPHCWMTLPEGSTSLSDCTSLLQLSSKNMLITAPPLTVSTNITSYVYGNQTLSQDYIRQNAICQPLNEYQWGFSFLLLFTFCLATLLILGILLLLQHDVYLNSTTNETKEGPSVYRDALDLAAMLKAKLGDEVQHLPRKELEERVGNAGTVVSIGDSDLPLVCKESFHTLDDSASDSKRYEQIDIEMDSLHSRSFDVRRSLQDPSSTSIRSLLR